MIHYLNSLSITEKLYESMQRFYSNPENEAKFKEWEENQNKGKDP